MTTNHKCGCITKTYKKGVMFIKICLEHQLNGKYVYVAVSHKRK
jgi:hypothetical protein